MKPFALGAPSRSLSVAVASTVRIDPRASGRGTAVRAGTGQRRLPAGSRRRGTAAVTRGDTALGNTGDVDRTELETGRSAIAELLEKAGAEYGEALESGDATKTTEPALGRRRALWLARNEAQLAELQRALEESRGNMSEAARIAGVDRGP